jgi:hypothetical protein
MLQILVKLEFPGHTQNFIKIRSVGAEQTRAIFAFRNFASTRKMLFNVFQDARKINSNQ